jgi:prepilin-type N-terminal cleavage/methylation domain-containing protein
MGKKGLTLIELMVGILVIALIATIGMVAMKNARAKSRDAKRVYDIQQYAKAFVMYAQENDGKFPSSSGYLGCNGEIDNQIREYLPDLPVDPSDPKRQCNGDYYYYYVGQNDCSGIGNIVPTLHIRKMETNNPDYHQNPCVAGSEVGGAKNAEYLIVVGF